jgi:exosortase/archaeosortase family protein
MSTTSLSATTTTNLRDEWRQRWQDTTPRTRTGIKTAVFVAVVAYAYHYSLTTLMQSLTLDSPLAYVGLVPLIAGGLAALRSKPTTPEPAIYDRQVDYIVGLPMVLAALYINLVMPRRLSTLFWVWRIDLLSFPLFVAGVACIVFGVRALWRQRLAVAFLLFAWPLPYTDLLLPLLNGFTNFTLSALHAVLHLVPVATPIAGSGGSLFQVSHHGRSFPLSVVSACTGVNGVVGFLLVGSAFAAIVVGPLLRKSLWLASGMVLLWAINLGRLVLIFWAGRTFGENFAIDTLHPFVGLVTFSLGVTLMILAMSPIGLRIEGPHIPVPQRQSTNSVAVPRVFAAFTVVALLGAVLGVSNGGLRAYDLVASATGEPKLASYTQNPGTPSGWAATYVDTIGWATPYFGSSSTWVRYAYEATGTAKGDLYSNEPITADVVNTNDLQSFSAYGVEACYRFHGYQLKDVAQVGLGGGITGQALSYDDGNADWTALWWIWPVKSTKTGSTRYERVILYMLNTLGATIQLPKTVVGVKGLAGALQPTTRVDQQLLKVRSFLVSFGREVVQAQAHVIPGSTLVSAHGIPLRRPPRYSPSQDVAQPPTTG